MSNESKSLIPNRDEYSTLVDQVKLAEKSGHYKRLGGYEGLMAIALYARELGVPPMQAFQGGMHNIQGKIEMSPQLMNRMIRQAGHKIEEVELTNDKCVLKGTRKDTGVSMTASFTIEDAKRAQIFKEGSGWSKYPQDMLFARTLSRLARRQFPDVIGVSYVEDEIEQKGVMEEAEVEFVKAKDPITVADLEQRLLTGMELSHSEQEKVMPFLERILESLPLEKLELHVNGWLTDQDKFLNSLHNFMSGKTKRQADLEAAQRQNSSLQTAT